jgi:hypothetical protein
MTPAGPFGILEGANQTKERNGMSDSPQVGGTRRLFGLFDVPSVTAALAAGTAVLLVIFSFLLFSAMTIPHPSGTKNQHQVPTPAEYDQLSLFFTVGAWAHDNRETIEPLAAIAAVVAAIILAYVTFLLFVATDRLAVTTRDLAGVGRDQVREMELARVLTERRVDLQEKQFLLTGRQTDLAEKQHGLQREQYLAEHRPRIKIRSIGILGAPGGIGPMFLEGRFINGSLVLVNAGASDATIREAEYRFFWGRWGLPMVPPLLPGQVQPLFEGMLPHKMTGHESCLIPIKSNEPLTKEAQSIILGGPFHLYVMGAVRFSDWDLKDRWMGFCHHYVLPEISGGEGRFVPVDNPDYEYED